jgi:mercuric ion binding protein
MKKILALFLFANVLVSCGENKAAPEDIKAEHISGAILSSTFKVWGNCETCKENIEGSLKADGISKADWNTETKLITVAYDSTKINLNQIEKSIAAAGYDNVTYKGDDKAYAELAPCCQYDRKK